MGAAVIVALGLPLHVWMLHPLLPGYPRVLRGMGATCLITIGAIIIAATTIYCFKWSNKASTEVQGRLSMSKLWHRTLLVIVAVCILNFLLFIVHASAIGGASGPIIGGHFYVRDHGKFTEVSEATYNSIRWHVLSLFVTHPLGMLIAYLLNKNKKRAL
jgi:ABC-type Fe3+ transport system permease subunit